MEGLDASNTPLHVTSLLGYKEIAEYLIQNGANPNVLGDNGYNALHFSVIGKQPEMTQYLLTNSNVDHTIKGDDDKSVKDLVQELLPVYLPHYEALLGSLPTERINEQMEENSTVVATHYQSPEDDRELHGVQNEEELNRIYQEAKAENEQKDDKNKRLLDMAEEDIKVEKDKETDMIIERVFGPKIALGLISTSWKFREEALKYILKQTPEKFESDMDFIDTIKA